MRHWRITGNSSVAIQTGSTYIGRYDILLQFRRQTWGFRLHALCEETDPGWLQQRPTTGNSNIDLLGANLAISIVDRCRNHLANVLSSSSSSKIPNLALEFRHYLLEFQRRNYFWLSVASRSPSEQAMGHWNWPMTHHI